MFSVLLNSVLSIITWNKINTYEQTQAHKHHAQPPCSDWDWVESLGLRSASAQCTEQATRLLIKRQLVFTRVSPSLTPASSSSNDDKTEGGWTPDGDDLLKEQVKWKQPCSNQDLTSLTTPSLMCIHTFHLFQHVSAHSYISWHSHP